MPLSNETSASPGDVTASTHPSSPLAKLPFFNKLLSSGTSGVCVASGTGVVSGIGVVPGANVASGIDVVPGDSVASGIGVVPGDSVASGIGVVSGTSIFTSLKSDKVIVDAGVGISSLVS